MHGVGRVVRWDAHAGTGAVVVEGLPAEISVAAGVVDGPEERDLQPGELVELTWEHSPDGPLRATRVCPTDAEP